MRISAPARKIGAIVLPQRDPFGEGRYRRRPSGPLGENSVSLRPFSADYLLTAPAWSGMRITSPGRTLSVARLLAEVMIAVDTPVRAAIWSRFSPGWTRYNQPG